MRSLLLIAAICTVLGIMMHRCSAETPVTTERPKFQIQPKRYMNRRAAQEAGGGAGGGMGFGFGANMGGQAGDGEGGH